MGQKNILFITHETSRSGAPLELLYFLEWLKNHYPIDKISILALSGGALEERFREVADNFISGAEFNSQHTLKWQKGLNFLKAPFSSKKKIEQDFNFIYANTVLSLPMALQLKLRNPKLKILLHVHELKTVINFVLPNFENKAKEVNFFITPSEIVKDSLINDFNIPREKIKKIYGFVPLKDELISRGSQYFTIGGCGAVEWRKGWDIFLQVAVYIRENYRQISDIRFNWIGSIPEGQEHWLNLEIDKLKLQNYVFFKGEAEEPGDYLKEFDVFAMTSREDPFPLVCIEAGMMGKPIICFEGATGTEEILLNGGGEKVPYLNVINFSKEIIKYYENEKKLKMDGEKAKVVFSPLNIENQAPKILECINDLPI